MHKFFFEIIFMLFVLFAVCYFTYCVIKKSKETFIDLDKIETKVINATTKKELDEALIELNNVHAFSQYHHYEVEKITEMIFNKMKGLK